MTSDIFSARYPRLIFALTYIYIPAILYPTILLLIQDVTYLSKVDFSRYFEPLQLTPFETFIVGLAFILIYIPIAVIVFIREAKIKFFIFTIFITGLSYQLLTYLYYIYFDTRGIGNLSPFVHGWAMVIAIVVGIWYSESLIFHIFGQSTLRPRHAPRTPDALLLAAFLLLPIVGYPLLMVFVEIFPNISHMRTSRMFEATQTSFFGYELQFLALIYLLVYTAVFTLAFVRVKRVVGFFAVSIFAYLIYNLGVECQIFIDVSLSASHMQANACKSTDLSTCLLFVEHGWIITGGFIVAALAVEGASRYLGGISLYEVPR